MIYGLQKLDFGDTSIWCRIDHLGRETMDHAIAEGCFEIEEHRDEVFSLPQNSTVFDIGGHIGTYSIMLKKMRPDISVYCFEPEPENYGLAVKNFMTNNVDVEPMQYAISNKNGWFDLNGYFGNSGGWSILNRTMRGAELFVIPVMARTVESICDHFKIESPTFIKIDVEGAEHAIMPSLSPRIMDNIMGFDVDFHPPEEYIKKTVAYLGDKGFTVDWTNKTKTLVYKEKWWQ